MLINKIKIMLKLIWQKIIKILYNCIKYTKINILQKIIKNYR